MESESPEHLLLDCVANRNKAPDYLYPSREHIASMMPSKILELIRVLRLCERGQGSIDHMLQYIVHYVVSILDTKYFN